MSRRVSLLATFAAGLLLAGPTSAIADTYVDDTSGNNTNPCTLAQPCDTVQRGVNLAGTGETVRIDGGNYAEIVVLADGKSLIEDDFNGADGASQAIIDGGGSPAVWVQAAETAGTIQGLTQRSTGNALTLDGPAASVTGNSFDSGADGSIGVLINNLAAGASTIGPGNSFSDDGDDDHRRRGVAALAGSPTITGNTFSALSDGVFLEGAGSATVVGNTITGTHVAAGSVAGRAISVYDGATPTIVDNHIHSQDPDPLTGAVGIDIGDVDASGATLSRNRIFGHVSGINVRHTTSPVSLNSDVIKDNSFEGLRMVDTIGGPAVVDGPGDVTATNVTFVGNATDIHLESTHLTLNSSIVEDLITGAGNRTCAISFSRGHVDGTGGLSCTGFQTAADPMFAADGYHLLAGSPMIDAGDPAAPFASNALDVDGDPRALDATPACAGNVNRRDIGADEFVAPAPTGCLPQVPSQVQPQVPSNTFTLGKVKRNRKKGTATVKVEVPNPGELVLSGKGVKTAGAAAVAKTVPAGAVKLLIKAKGKKRKTLNKTGKVKVKLKVTYTPTGGTPSTQSRKLKLRKR